jgi:hypothetical protein
MGVNPQVAVVVCKFVASASCTTALRLLLRLLLLRLRLLLLLLLLLVLLPPLLLVGLSDSSSCTCSGTRSGVQRLEASTPTHTADTYTKPHRLFPTSDRFGVICRDVGCESQLPWSP